MPIQFSFADNGLLTPTYVALASLTQGPGPGVNNANHYSAIAPSQVIERAGDVDVLAITLLAGQNYLFDIDGGAGDASGGSVDIEVDLIDHEGSLVASSSSNTVRDIGSFSTADPLLNVQVNKSGTYFLAVHGESTSYVDDFFSFTPGATGIGDYSLVISTLGLVPRTVLTNGSEVRSFSDARQNIVAAGGNDVIFLAGGNDLGLGGTGNDSLYGGTGDDELNGQSGNDRLDGGIGNDVINGSEGFDLVFGSDGLDALTGYSSTDTLFGGNGDDTIWGNTENDLLYGGAGQDFIRGGTGVDLMRGEGGSDTFHFIRGESPFSAGGSEDRILDFETVDALDLSDLVNGLLTYRGFSGFTGANQVRAVDYRAADGSGFQEVRVNLDANLSTVELAFFVDKTGALTLTSGDFML